MNIFYLSHDPQESTQMLCDKHVVKMTLETTQIMLSIFHEHDWISVPCKRSHHNHPCCRWSRESLVNWAWLLEYGRSLACEYAFRYKKDHKCMEVMEWAANRVDPALFLRSAGMTPPPLVINSNLGVHPILLELFKTDPVSAHREAYKLKVAAIDARWDNGRGKPAFLSMPKT